MTMLARCCRRLPLLLLVALLGLPAAVRAVEDKDDFSLADYTSTQVRDYLSDPRRAGSLVGGILGGALTVHPAGPMLGSVIGFIVGKQSMFEAEGRRMQHADVRSHTIVPAAGMPVATLSFAHAEEEEEGRRAGASLASTPQQASRLSLAATSGINAIDPGRLATLCRSDGSVLQPALRRLCFYSQSF